MLIPRLISALVMLLLVYLALFIVKDQHWPYVVLALVALAAWEWPRLFGWGAQLIQVSYSLVLVSCVWALWQLELAHWLVFLVGLQLLVIVYGVLRFQLTQGQKSVFQPIGLAMILGALFISSFGLAMIELRLNESVWLLLYAMALVWVMDTGAYFTGRRWGKRKLAAYVSPGKTWEGVWGGLLLVSVFALMVWGLTHYASATEVWIITLISLLVAFVSVGGDLLESVLKRQAGIKDSGRLIPGHGGVLDRIDSLLIAVPLFYVVWLWLLA